MICHQRADQVHGLGKTQYEVEERKDERRLFRHGGLLPFYYCAKWEGKRLEIGEERIERRIEEWTGYSSSGGEGFPGG
jgi:hypothetical protein